MSADIANVATSDPVEDNYTMIVCVRDKYLIAIIHADPHSIVQMTREVTLSSFSDLANIRERVEMVNLNSVIVTVYYKYFLCSPVHADSSGLRELIFSFTLLPRVSDYSNRT